ncbi:hypothetical protein [Timonella sp. A28]|uniref:hypothetical protein n=1 Tax=Timonella sp. A28 TaxID=3442640 RepID=UPI003EBEC043
MKKHNTPTATKTPRSSSLRKRRTILVSVLVILGVLCASLAVTARWIATTITDEDKYVSAVSNLAQDHQIQGLISRTITDTALEKADIEQRIAESDNETLGKINRVVGIVQGRNLGDQLEAYIRPRLTNAINQVISSTTFQNLWAAANRETYSALMSALEDPDRSQDTIAIDLTEIIRNANTSLSSVERIDNALARTTITVPLLEEEQLSTLRAYYNLVNALAVWLPIVAVAALGMALYLARRTMLTGISIAVLIIASAGIPYFIRFAIHIFPPQSLMGDEMSAVLGERLVEAVLDDVAHAYLRVIPIGGAILLAVLLAWYFMRRRVI